MDLVEIAYRDVLGSQCSPLSSSCPLGLLLHKAPAKPMLETRPRGCHVEVKVEAWEGLTVWSAPSNRQPFLFTITTTKRKSS